ncbi:ribonuclease III [Subtercola boreus]|uniref:Ribonuclease 3 n=1 Tax=Subtercola boreus TaxID=120213 RepID=A0A3E0WCE1_9MICO|nr:ribonuclease III [Subtercola boreus]RFA22414.1 ribonuclease III [Subtercola boreus]RFA22476.1 ribonuclease III [Subtercola boreus]RFA28491.1 ribonuclease III [Subtercola boreus]
MSTAAADPDRAHLLSTLGVEIPDALLNLALTHRSWSYEHGGVPTNERLEFLGDSILGQAVTVMLYTRYPELGEGELAKRRASLVSTVALAGIGKTIGLGAYVLLGRGEDLTGGRSKSSILADTVEALIGATYLGLGGDTATQLVLRLVEPLILNPDTFGESMDPKTGLQELAATLGAEAPLYVVTESGPDHRKIFCATVTVGALVTASGEGSSKKQAESLAARRAHVLLATSLP